MLTNLGIVLLILAGWVISVLLTGAALALHSCAKGECSVKERLAVLLGVRTSAQSAALGVRTGYLIGLGTMLVIVQFGSCVRGG